MPHLSPVSPASGGSFNIEDITPGCVMQITPENKKVNQAFAGCFMVINEVRPEKALGYVQALGSDRSQIGGQAYIFIDWKDLAYVGQAQWVVSR